MYIIIKKRKAAYFMAHSLLPAFEVIAKVYLVCGKVMPQKGLKVNHPSISVAIYEKFTLFSASHLLMSFANSTSCSSTFSKIIAFILSRIS